ncbi:MAG: methyltransferase [Pseudonocardiaceae bacterium]|nr:methyltransferase [Pseudonocardiaceae bacterium]
MEWVAAAEVEAAFPDASGIAMARREITFTLPELEPRTLALRCADDAFLLVGELPPVGSTKADLPGFARDVAHLDWHAAAEAVGAVRGEEPSTFDCVVSIEGKHSYNRYAVEDAVGDALCSVLGLRFLSRSPAATAFPDQPDMTVRLFLRGTRAIATFRIGRRPLHRRGYKVATGPGTLHPPLAAALAAIAGAGGLVVHDPFCGDGTLAIETALSWPTSQVTAGDIDPERVTNTHANATRAGVDIVATVADAGDLRKLGTGLDLLLTNPPWDVAVGSHGQLRASLRRFWSDAATVLRGSGRVCTVTDAALEVPDVLQELGFAVGLTTRLRLAGRVAHVSIAAAPDGTAPQLPSRLTLWRHRAISKGVITEHGF